MEIKMRAFAVRSLGEPASLQDLPAPTAHAEVLIRARFAGVNPLDNKSPGKTDRGLAVSVRRGH